MRSIVSDAVVAVMLVSGVMGGSAMAQDTASTQLETQLQTIFKITRVEMVGNNVTKLGSIVSVAKNNLLFETPVNQPVVCGATVKESGDQVASTMCRLTMKGRGGFLLAGQKLFITKIKANVPKDTVTFDLTEAAIDPATNLPGHPSYKTEVSFVFANGYLSKADAGQLADVISKVLPIDDGASAQQQPQAPPPPEQITQAPPRQAPPPPPMPGAAIELGMTEQQVRAIMGQPTSQQRPASGNGKVYVYSKQITFENGVVTAIQ